MRKRIIKPSFWSSERLAGVSHGARLTYIGLWQLADRSGHLRYNPRWIGAQLYPYESVSVEDWLNELEKAGEIFVWDSECGHRVLTIRHFEKHQHVHPNEAESEYDDEFNEKFTLGIP